MKTRPPRYRLSPAITFALLAQLLAGASTAQLVTEDLTGPLTPMDLASVLVGSGVSISNVTYTGADVAAGTFIGGETIIGIEDGIILSSGDVANVIGPNTDDGITAANGTPGDADLDALAGGTTFDAAVLEFDFVPSADTLFIQYVFSSDEYNEFVFSINDVFAFFVNGTNCALTPPDATSPGLSVSVDTINNGNPFGDPNAVNPELYINNDLDDGGGSIDTEMDGLTVVLVCEAAVNANVTNQLKLAIADESDSVLDSNVFLKAGSITTEPPGDVPPVEIPTLGGAGLVALILSLSVAALWLIRRRDGKSSEV